MHVEQAPTWNFLGNMRALLHEKMRRLAHFFVAGSVVLLEHHYMRLSITLLFLTVCVLGVVHFLALEFYLYWQYTWFDIPVHILGGIAVAFSFFVLREQFPVFLRELARPIPFMVGVLGIGVFWELFELWAGISIQKNYAFDTSLDLLMDVVGGLVGYIIGSRTTAL